MLRSESSEKRKSTTASGAVSAASTFIEDNSEIAVLAAAVVVPVLLFQLLRLLRAIAVPALILFAAIVGLGVSTELSARYPDLGSPLQVFTNLSGLTAIGVGGTVVVVKVREALDAIGAALKKPFTKKDDAESSSSSRR